MVRRHPCRGPSPPARGNQLSQELLDIVSIETGHLSVDRRPEAVEPLLAQLEMTFTSAAAASDSGIRLLLALQPGLRAIVADRERILQVLANLVSNALRFSFSLLATHRSIAT